MKFTILFAIVLTASVANAQTATTTEATCYELRIYTAQKGKLNDLLRRFRKHTTKIFETHKMTNVGYWTPIDNPDEKLYYILSYPNRAARDLSWKAFVTDTTWQRVAKESEANGGLVAKVESIFLKTTDFSNINLKSSNCGVWEWRTYTCTDNNLVNLQSRFRDHTRKLFEKHGITNQMYFTDAGQGADKMLYYFISHTSESAAKKSFDAFRADPEWVRVRKESEVKGGGSLTVKVESLFMQPTDFSPIK
jgi:NIPSNAP